MTTTARPGRGPAARGFAAAALLLAAVGAAAVAGPVTAAAGGADPPRTTSACGGEEYHYGPDARQTYDVSYPSSAARAAAVAPGAADDLPAVIAFHGGAHHGGAKCTANIPPPAYFGRFAALGMVVFNVEYRLTVDDRPGTLRDRTVADAVLAVRTIEARARFHGTIPGRVITFGESAGGHLAFIAADRAGGVVGAFATSPTPLTARSYVETYRVNTYAQPFPASYLPRIQQHRRSFTPPRGAPADQWWNDVDPSAPRNVAASPPVQLIISNAADAWTHPGQTAEYARAARAAGKRLTVFQPYVRGNSTRNGAHGSTWTRLTGFTGTALRAATLQRAVMERLMRRQVGLPDVSSAVFTATPGTSARNTARNILTASWCSGSLGRAPHLGVVKLLRYLGGAWATHRSGIATPRQRSDGVWCAAVDLGYAVGDTTPLRAMTVDGDGRQVFTPVR